MTDAQYEQKAMRIWRANNAWFCGKGRYALTRECYRFTVERFRSLAEAKVWLNMNAEHCGYRCFPGHLHFIYDLKNFEKGPIDEA